MITQHGATQHKTKIAIIGASLSGLMAGRALWRRGVTDFLVLDRKREIGFPLKCGEAVEAGTFDELFGPGLMFPFVKSAVHSHSIFWEGCIRILRDAQQLRFYEIDRVAMEQWMAEPILPRIRLRTGVRRIQRTRRGFRIETNRGAVEAQAMALCCGATYGLHRSLGLLQNKPRLGHAFGELHVGDAHINGFNEEVFTWEILGSCQGYGWGFPKGNGCWNVGVLGFRPEHIRTAFSRFKQKYRINTTPVCQLGGRFPQDGVLPKTVGDRLVVCGDAAGMVFAATGEGIRFALASGQYAGEVLAAAAKRNDFSQNTLREYEARWRMRFGRELRAGVTAKKLLIALERTGYLKFALRRASDRRLKNLVLGQTPKRSLVDYLAVHLLGVFKTGLATANRHILATRSARSRKELNSQQTLDLGTPKR